MDHTYKSLVRFSWFIFLFTFLVILAGGVVRMTQSGMGCPDWPKCFGLWIPPTDASQLPEDFEKYLSKQDIDHSFNVYHTWIEYINRLVGVLLGFFILIYTVYVAVWYRKYKQGFLKIALFLLIAVILQGILGAIVVYQNLAVSTITIHLIGAMVIAILPLVNIAKTKQRLTGISRKELIPFLIFTVVVFIQFMIGTQVRENIDVVSKSLQYLQRDLWIGGLDFRFLIHRSFSWIVLFTYAYLYYAVREHLKLRRAAALLGFLIFINIVLGVVMNYLSMPAIAQPLHLLGGCLLLVSIVYFILRMTTGAKEIDTRRV